MRTMRFSISPASLQGLPCNPQKGCEGGWCPAATQRDGAKDLLRRKENLEDLADTHFAPCLIARVLQGMKSLKGMGQL